MSTQRTSVFIDMKYRMICRILPPSLFLAQIWHPTAKKEDIRFAYSYVTQMFLYLLFKENDFRHTIICTPVAII